MFIKFTKLEFTNYKCIKHSSLNLDDRGVTLIKGTNNDKTGSNGAGKSTLQNGLLWCLYGKTLEGKETESEIIPRKKFVSTKEFKASGGCCVSVYLNRGDVEYKISRYRKSPVYKNTSVIMKKVDDLFEDISKCVDKETDALIVDIVGADYESFVYSNVFSFNTTEPFLKRSDKDKKELIIPTFFINMFKGAYKRCTEEIGTVQDKLQVLTGETMELDIKASEKILRVEELDSEIAERVTLLKDTEDSVKAKKGEISFFEESIRGCKHRLTIFENEVIKAQKGVAKCKDTYYGYLSKIEERNKQKTYILSIKEDIANKKATLIAYGNSDNDAIINQLTELSKKADEKGAYFVELSSKKDECNKLLAEKQKSLEEAEDSKEKLCYLLNEVSSNISLLNNKLSANSGKSLQLMTQRKSIDTKYYSEQCKSCPHSKSVELLNSIEYDLEGLGIEAKRFDRKKAELLNVEGELNEDLRQITFAASNIYIELEKSKKDEIEPIDKELYLVERELHVIKEGIQGAQYKVDNYDKVLKEVSTTHAAIKALEKTLITEIDVLTEMNKEQYPLEEVHLEESKHAETAGEYATRYDEMKEKLIETLSNIKIREEQIKALTDVLNSEDKLTSKKALIFEELYHIGKLKGVVEDKQQVLNSKLDMLKVWKIGFGPAGIEGFMLDSIINTMNALINKYLSYLSNGIISLTLIPESTLKSGESRNKISEKVENDFGGPTYRTNSEGEKRTMDISVLFALKYIYEQISGTQYNILWLDEAFDTLDAPTCNLVIGLINSLENVDSIFVVSHIDGISLEFDEFVDVIKTNGITEIVE